MGLRMRPTDLDGTVSTGAQDGVCVVCSNSLAHYRSDALCCSASCRAEKSRVSAILNGTFSGPYRSLKERDEARQKRTQRRSWACLGQSETGRSDDLMIGQPTGLCSPFCSMAVCPGPPRRSHARSVTTPP